MIKINVDTLDKNTSIPLYFQLEEILKEKIAIGGLQLKIIKMVYSNRE